MLNLRKNLVFGKKRRSSVSSSIASDGADRPSTSSTMAAAQPGFSDAGSGLKPGQRPASVHVTELYSSDSEGHTVIDSQVLEADTSGKRATSNFSRVEHFARPAEVTRYVKEIICRLPEYNEAFVTEMDLRSYLQYISDERLIHMPRKGSGWDRVLSTAQFFGLQVWFFGSRIEEFVPGCAGSARAALASCQVLLDIGHHQADALAPTFTALYELAMLLSTISQVRDLKQMPADVLKGAADIFLDIVYLVSNISEYYKQKISSLKHNQRVKISFDHHFGRDVDHIWRAKNTLCDNIWRYKLAGKASINDLRRLRLKLQPSSGTSVRNTLYDEVLEHLDRSEDTCTWIRDALVQFFDSNEQALAVEGPAGFGKTVLAEWVQERLARPLDYKSYSVLQYNFPFDSVNEASSTSFLKSILFQLLEQNVGEYQLYEYLSNAFAQDRRNKHDPKKLEESLWEVLHLSLKLAEKGDSTIVLLADGCDDTSGSFEKVADFNKQLRKYTSRLVNTRIISFSRLALSPGEKTRQLTITEQNVSEDIKTHFRQTLGRSRHWPEFTIVEQEDIVNSLAKKANGSFLWAFEASRLLVPKHLPELTHDAFKGLAKSIPSDITKLLNLVVDRLDLKQSKTLQLILSFMLMTKEPFSVAEMSELLAVNPDKLRIDSSTYNIGRLAQDCSDLVVIRGGRLHFRSAGVRNHLQAQLGKQLLSESETHLQLSNRMLLYAKLTLESDQGLMTDALDDSVVDVVLAGNKFLGYVLRNWILHFGLSGQIGSKGEMKLGNRFDKYFPNSVMFVLLERSYWARYYFGHELAELHEYALKIRESCFGENHDTVLQTVIHLGHIHVAISESPVQGARYFYRAVQIGKSSFSSETHPIVVSCTSLFLNWTKNITITTRTDIVTYREEMIRLMITICKHKHGDYSDEVIAWYEILAKLYVSINEEWRATIVYRELREIIILRFGAKSKKAKELGDFLGDVDIVLKGSEDPEHIHKIEELIFETSENMELTSQICINMLIKLAQSYVVCGKFFLAERLFLSLWRRICVIGRVNTSLDVHVAKITIALEYVKFLRKVKRVEEATSILICLWSEYENYECELEALIIWIREIGHACRSFGLLSVTISIFTKVWGWFKSKGKGGHEEAQQTTILITEVVEEWTETTVTEKTTTTTTTETTESVVKEIYEMHYTRCKKSGVDKRFFSACMALIGLYIKNNNWVEAEVVIKKSLEISWMAILSADVKLKLTEHWAKECVVIARRLGNCYHRSGLFEMAEKMYLRIYYACLASCQMEDEMLQESISILIKFYEEHHRHDKVIDIYVEVLQRYRKTLGKQHKLTIKTLYLLAAACELIGHKDAYVYYLDIVAVLNKGQKHCHGDAFKACLWLFRHYHAQKKWSEFREVCYVLWETLCNHDHECDFSEDVTVEIYTKFTSVLEMYVKVDFKVLYEMTVKYKDVVNVRFGMESSIYILALISLAELCEKNEDHYHEAITIYEEVLKRIATTKTKSTTITETTVTTVKKRLAKLYVTVITTGKGGAKKTYPVDRAVDICLETYAKYKVEFGCWHEKTLAALKDVVLLHLKIGGKESHTRITQLLQASVTEIITTVTITANLFKAALTLGSIYLTSGFAKEGHELLRQLRHLVIFRGTLPGLDITLKLNRFPSKIVFVFLTSFEKGLSGEAIVFSYTEIMVNIIFESILYDEYARVIERDEKIEIILECGAKLRGFWEEHKRKHLIETLDAKLFQLFKKKFGNHFGGAVDSPINLFYLALLIELNKDRSTKVDFPALACKAGNDRVRVHLDKGDFMGAQEVAHVVFHFAKGQQLYYQRSCIQYGYKLAELMAGIDAPHPPTNKPSDVRKAMLDTSRDIMTEVLAAFRSKDIKIDMLELRFQDLTGLIRLLGTQNNFGELEALLVRLWNARESMQRYRGWSPEVVLNVGKMLVDAQVAHGHLKEAIDTAELLYYNLRRGRGRLDLETLSFARVLASLYTNAGRHSSAMGIHEAALREIGSAYQRNSANDVLPDRARLVAEARLHLELMRASHYHMKAWNKPTSEISEMYVRLKSSLKLEIPAFDQWANGKADKNAPDGKYLAPQEWKLNGEVKDSVSWKRASHQPHVDNMDVIQAARGWWLVRW